ncbi:MAG: helix-turn-helix domain-containing protein [Parachlamydiales bacterium]|jgi:transcriptional regulator with XRE-family HTH domain
MSIDLKGLGQMFKEKREEMHLSLKEIENATSIRISYLQAIEEGSAEKLLSGVYILGFIKQYGGFLGIDAEKIIKQNPRAFMFPAVRPEFDYGLGTLDIRGPRGGSEKWRSNLLWMGLGVGFLFLAWLFARFLGLWK